MSMARAVRMIRDAISPRLAISSLRMGVIAGFSLVTVPSLVTGPHIRKTPKPRRPATGPECAADRAMPSTVRVSRGSMTPSS